MRLPIINVLALIGLSAGCTYHVWSPPARAIPISGVGRLAGGEVRAQVTGSFHDSLEMLDDRPVAIGGALGGALGLGEGVDLRLGGQAFYLAGGATDRIGRGIVAGRVGLRWAPEDWVAVSGGLGAGASVAGAFVNPDLGLTLGDGGPDVGFFVDLRGGVSLPVDPITLNLALPGEEARLATPTPTAVIQVTPGMRFTLLHTRPSEVGLVLRVTPNLTILADEKLSSLWVGAALSLEVVWPSE